VPRDLARLKVDGDHVAEARPRHEQTRPVLGQEQIVDQLMVALSSDATNQFDDQRALLSLRISPIRV
jgi:hypothetical protein